MRELMLVAAGGAIGACARYAIGLAAGTRFQGGVPWHTFAINIVGAFALGLLMAWVSKQEQVPVAALVFLGTGLLGGFTTFSTFAYESLALVSKEAWLSGFGYLFGSAIAGIVAAWAGVVAGRAL